MNDTNKGSPAHGWPQDTQAPVSQAYRGHFDDMRLDLFVGNLPYYIDDQALFDMAADFGTVLRVRVICSKETGQSRGFAFVRAATPEDQRAIISGLHNRMLARRALHARPLTPGGGPREGA